jgi:hypothetical protein
VSLLLLLAVLVAGLEQLVCVHLSPPCCCSNRGSSSSSSSSRRRSSRGCTYFAAPLQLVAMAASLGLLFTLPSLLLFYATVPFDLEGGGGSGGGLVGDDGSAGGVVGNASAMPGVNWLEAFVAGGLGITPAAARSSAEVARRGGVANATTTNIACELVFEPLNAWALLCLLCQWRCV